MEIAERSVAAGGLGSSGMNRQNTVKLFGTILQWWMHVIIHLSKPIGCTQCTVWTWDDGMIMIYQCRLTDCDKYTLVMAIDSGGGCVCVGQQVYTGSL